MVIRERIEAREPFELGELRVTFEAGTAIVSGPSRGTVPVEVEASRLAIRNRVRFDDGGHYRPLPTAESMCHDWSARCNPGEVEELLDEIYPLAITHIEQWAAERLRVVSLDDVLGRQQGRYTVAAELDEEGRAVARDVLCGRCVRAPVWSGEAPAHGQIPCPEPCSVMVSLCREAALWQRDPPAPSEANADVAFAAFNQPGNEVREAFLGARWKHG